MEEEIEKKSKEEKEKGLVPGGIQTHDLKSLTCSRVLYRCATTTAQLGNTSVVVLENDWTGLFLSLPIFIWSSAAKFEIVFV